MTKGFFCSFLVVLHGGVTVNPTLACGLGQQELYFCVCHQYTGTVGHLKVDGQHRTHHALGIVVLAVTHFGELLVELLQLGQLAQGRGRKPRIAVPGIAGVAGTLFLAVLGQIGHHVIGHVLVAYLVGLNLTTGDVHVVTADLIQTGVVVLLHIFYEGGAYKRGRLRVLTVKHLAKGVHTEIELIGSGIQGERTVHVLDVGIFLG